MIDYPDEVPTLATFPVVPGRADQIVPVDVSQGVEQQQVFFFPQMGDGVVANIRFQTSFIFLNPRIAGSGREVPLVIEFFASDGNPARIELTGRGSGSRFDFSLATGEVLALQTAGTAPIQAGYARITTGPSVGGTAVFTQSQIDSGIVVYEAGVPATGPIQEFSVVVDTLAEKDIGLAMVNPPQILPAGPPKSAQVTLRLYDNTFQLLGEEQLELAPGQHLPRFLNQFFESIANQLEDLRGLLTVASDRPLAVVTLRQRDDPSVDFPADVPTLTAFPVLTGRPETAP